MTASSSRKVLAIVTLALSLGMTGVALATSKNGAGAGSGGRDCAADESACKAQCSKDYPGSENAAALCVGGCGASRVICDLANKEAMRPSGASKSTVKGVLKKN